MNRIIGNIGWGLTVWALALTARALVPDPVFTNYYWGRPFDLPATPREMIFQAADKRANFTDFEGVENLVVQDGKIAFTLTTNKAVLGWGNYLDQQPIADRVDTWEKHNDIYLKVRQSGASSVWTVIYWADGKRMKINASDFLLSAVMTNSGPADLKFTGLVMDGFELQIAGNPGERIEIESVRLVQPLHEGYVRTEFTLPEGKIWRAVADVGYANHPIFDGISSELHINGQLVKRRGSRQPYGTAPVDIASYLKPGKNCIAFHGRRILPGGASPFIYFQSRIVMASGQMLTVQTDKKSWKYSPKEEVGWNQPGLNDTAWKPATEGGFYGGIVGMEIPAHQGLVLLRNPLNKDLIYLETNAVVIETAIPAGLKDKVAELEYVFSSTDKEGKSTPVKEGRVTEFKTAGDSLVYRMDVGRQPRGVYTIELRLKGKDGVIEDHPREPVMVLRQFSGKPVEGQDYFEGLDVELEDTIDFADPNDPHSWYEVTEEGGKLKGQIEPLIVRTNGLVYRQVAWDKDAGAFSYRMNAFKHPGDFYVMELEYPDNAWRVTQVSISHNPTDWSASLSGVGTETGGRFYLTGKMQKLRWICVGQAGIHSVDIKNVIWPNTDFRPKEPAVARSLKVYHVKGDLPLAAVGAGREFGIQTERSSIGSGVAHNFGDNPELVALQKLNSWKTKADDCVPMVVKNIRWLKWLQDTAERYAQYCRFAGQTKHIMGCFQYGEGNTPFEHPWEYPTARINPDFREILANVLNANGINIYAGFELAQFIELNTRVNDWQVAHRGSNTVWMINAKGQQFAPSVAGDSDWQVMNMFHPQCESSYRNLLTELAEKFGHLPQYKGVWMLLITACFHPECAIPGFGSLDDPLAYSYDDYTFTDFEKDTGVDLGIRKADPLRFEKRAMAVQNPSVQKKYVAWRAQRVLKFLAGGLETLRARRPDLRLLTALYAEEALFFKTWLTSGKPYREFLMDFGFDPEQAGKIPGLAMGRWTCSWSGFNGQQNPYVWLARVNPEFTSVYDRPTDRYVFVRSMWNEDKISFNKGGIYKNKLVESDWIYDGYKLRTLPQPAHVHCREAQIQALITGDPDTLTYGMTDLNINVGNEQELREFARVYTHLPKERFAPVLDTGLDTNLAIRRLAKDGKTYLYAVNPGFWPIRGTLTLKGKGEVKDLVTGRSVKTETRGEARMLPVELAPFMLTAFVADDPNLDVTAYTVDEIPAAERAYLKWIVTRVKMLSSDPETRLALAPKDRDYIATQLSAAEKALKERQYARAWAVLTDTKFWALWKNFLEPAAVGLARLSPAFEKEDEDQRQLMAYPASAPITLDGKLDEADWKQGRFSGKFVNADNLPAVAETALKALYDDKHLYLGFVCADKDVKALKASDTFSWGDDAMALFIQPDEKTRVYYQLGFNLKGIQFNQRNDQQRETSDYVVRPAWKSATAQGEGYWTAEVMIPCAELGVTTMTDTAWRVNFHRVVRDKLLVPSSWNYPGYIGWKGPWHNTDRFGRLLLVAKKP